MSAPHPLLSRSFWLLQKTILPPHLHFSAALSHTLICIFSLGSLPYLSIHPVTPVIHLFFLFPPCFFPLLHCGGAEPHLNAQPVMSSLPALGIFTGMKKCNHPFLSNIISQQLKVVQNCLHAMRWMNLFPACLHVLIAHCMDTLIFHSLLCAFLWWLSRPVLLRQYAKAFQCLLSCLQTSRERQGRGESKEEGEGSKWGVGKNYRGLEKRAVAQPWKWRERWWGREWEREREIIQCKTQTNSALVVVQRTDQRAPSPLGNNRLLCSPRCSGGVHLPSRPRGEAKKYPPISR